MLRHSFKNSRLIGLVGSAALLGGIWYLGQAASSQVARLKVLPPPQARAVPALAEPKNYYPAWAKRAPVTVEGGDVDGALAAPPPPVVQSQVAAVVKTDVAAQIRVRAPALLTGASDRGAFIAGEFIGVGQRVHALTQFDGVGGQSVPVLLSASPTEVRLQVDKQTITLRVQGGF